MLKKSNARLSGRNNASSRNFFIIAILCFSLLLLWSRIVITIPPGNVGTLWLRFFGGTLKHFYFRDGTKVIFPWDRIYIYDSRLRRFDRNVEALTSDGLKVDVLVSATYFINKGEVAEIHEGFGPNYEALLVEPITVSQVALFVADRSVDEMYSLARTAITTKIIEAIQTKIAEISGLRGDDAPAVEFVDINIRSVLLPQAFGQSVETKLTAQQEVLRRQFVIEQQRLENEQKILAARGLQTVQSIITPGLTDAFLKWEAIQVSAQLAASNNAKTVVLGSGSSGVPVLLGVGQPETTQSPQVPSPAPSGNVPIPPIVPQ